MWVEPDLNMPDGESQVRQLLIGTRYFKEKFGVKIRVGWNPDSFGYNWQLPQIYKKSGMDFFVTQKLAWNDTTKPPFALFWWESPDGSRVLTYFPHDYVNSLDPLKMSRDLADFEQKTHYPEMMHLFGIGDHGGGPTRAMLEEGCRWQDPGVIFPRIQFGTAQSYLDAAAAKADSLRCRFGRASFISNFTAASLPHRRKQKRTIAAMKPCFSRRRNSPRWHPCMGGHIPAPK